MLARLQLSEQNTEVKEIRRHLTYWGKSPKNREKLEEQPKEDSQDSIVLQSLLD